MRHLSMGMLSHALACLAGHALYCVTAKWLVSVHVETEPVVQVWQMTYGWSTAEATALEGGTERVHVGA